MSNQVNWIASAPPPMGQAPPVFVPLHTTPTPIEQAHINQALEASKTAIDGISAIVAVSTWALGILTILIAAVGIWGYVTIRRSAGEQAKQIANARFDDYIETDEFKEMVKARIEKSVQERWENTVVANHLDEERKDPNDPSPFPPGDVG